ncbi:MAG: nicotinate-nucleotide adenylyltransferase [Granulosicoccaceae bacterium]
MNSLPDSAVGILGGTFDPVHCAHLRIALDILERCRLTQIRLIPNAQSPLRDPAQASNADRLAMLQAAIAGETRFIVDARELDREGPSFTVDTLAQLRRELGETPLCFILGADAFSQFHHWHDWPGILELAHLVVAQRPGCGIVLEDDRLAAAYEQRRTDDVQALHNSPAGTIYVCEVTQLAVSATQVRSRVQTGKSARWLVPDAVWEYIQQHRLYQ